VTPSTRAKLAASISQSEGRISWLYRDSAEEGNATTGVGHLVASYPAAQLLPFDTPITAGEWQELMSAPVGLVASAYRQYTVGRLSYDAIDSLLDLDLSAAEKSLSARWAKFPAFPESAQMALVDMVYNLGLGGLLKFTHLCAAVDSQDWATAAKECHRQGISEARNQLTAARFQEAILE